MGGETMKMPARAEKVLKLLDDIKYTVDYYSGGAGFHKKDFDVIKDYIAEISESKKLSEIKLAVKIKKDLDEDSN